MRIIAGKYKGRKIKIPNLHGIKPTTNLAKESLFNILNHKIDFNSVSVLDLFCGIGSITFEFISRGVYFIASVDINRKYIFYLNENLKNFNISKNIFSTYVSDVIVFLKNNFMVYDLIFLDPPYNFNQKLIFKILNLLFTYKYSNIYIILEHHYKIYNLVNKHTRYYFTKKYGKTCFSFFR